MSPARQQETNHRAAQLALGVLLALGLAAPLLAQQPSTVIYRDANVWVEELQGTVPVGRTQQLTLRSERGSITVRTGPAGEIRYRVRKLAYKASEQQAREMFREFVVEIQPVGTEFRVLGEHQRRHWSLRHFSVDYELTVPASFRASLETRGGDIYVEGLQGWLRAGSAGGNIRTGDIGGEASVETAGGNISLGSVGGPLRARTAGGDIRVSHVRGAATLETSGGSIVCGRVEGTVRARTAGGDIEIEAATGDIVAGTAGGRILVGEAGGRVQAETAGGSIRVLGADGPVEAETAGGRIELERIRGGVRAATAAGNILARLLGEGKLAVDSLLQTSFGDIEVYLPPELAVTIEATIEMAAGHNIRTDFPLKIEGAGDYAFSANRLRGFGELNGGGQLLKIHTVGGDIVIRKLTDTPGPLPAQRLDDQPDKRWKRWQELWKRRKGEQPQP